MSNVSENLKRGTIELLLLFLIQEQDMYGYQISQALEQRSGGRFTLQEGSLYTPLYRLEKQGFISSRHHKVENSKRFRVYYHLEPEGEKELQEITREYFSINRGILNILGMESFDENFGQGVE